MAAPEIAHSERRFQEAFEGQDFFLLLEADRHIAMASQRLRVLKYVNPINSSALSNKYTERDKAPREDPEYQYKELDFDPEGFKVELLNLPIINSELGRIYRAKRDEVFNILAMLEARGSKEFLDWSRLLYGTTDKKTLEAAQQWLKLEPEPEEPQIVDAKEAKNRLTTVVRKQHFLCDIRIRNYMSSDAAAGELAVALKKNAMYSDNDIKSLAVHEIETHVLRTRNGEIQPFRALFFHGFPRMEEATSVYLATEEGLATFNEELAGVLTNRRRRILAGRVKAVYLMDKEEMSFYDIFNTLVNDDKFTREEAYTISERVYRGGGYTKDHLYLNGYEQVKKLWSESPEGFELLYTGKVGVAHLPIIKRLFKNGNGILYPARHLPAFFSELEATKRLRMPQPAAEDDEHDD